MENNTLNVKEKLCSVAAVVALLLGSAIGAGYHNTAVGISLLVVSTTGIGCILGVRIGQKRARGVEVHA